LEKPGFGRFLQGLGSKLTGLWNKLIALKNHNRFQNLVNFKTGFRQSGQIPAFPWKSNIPTRLNLRIRAHPRLCRPFIQKPPSATGCREPVTNTGFILGASPLHGLPRAWVPGYQLQFLVPWGTAPGLSTSPAPADNKTTRQQNLEFNPEQIPALRISILILRMSIFKAGPEKQTRPGCFIIIRRLSFADIILINCVPVAVSPEFRFWGIGFACQAALIQREIGLLAAFPQANSIGDEVPILTGFWDWLIADYYCSQWR
jgi:hypothetical protein